MNNYRSVAAANLILLALALNAPVTAGPVSDRLAQAMKTEVLEELRANVKTLFVEGIDIKQRFAVNENYGDVRRGFKPVLPQYGNRRNKDLLHRIGYDF